jgi:hypothetical protein
MGKNMAHFRNSRPARCDLFHAKRRFILVRFANVLVEFLFRSKWPFHFFNRDTRDFYAVQSPSPPRPLSVPRGETRRSGEAICARYFEC